MTKRAALRLHNEDEVIVKKTGEAVTLLCEPVDDEEGIVLMETINAQGQFETYTHREVC